MKELTKILEEMLEDTIKLIDNCSNSSQEQNKWRDNFLSKYENKGLSSKNCNYGISYPSWR